MRGLLSLLFLQKLRGIGTVSVNKTYIPLLELGADFDEIVNAAKSGTGLPNEEIESARKLAEAEYKELEDRQICVITELDEEYPQRLYDLGDNRPLYLYVQGDIHVLDGKTFGVIGTRNPSPWTLVAGKNLVQKAAELGCGTIVSGLALGCDTIGHETALAAGIPTAAVLPSGFWKIVPSQNRELVEKIVSSGGCLISEYAPAMAAEKYTYVRRDALIAALSDRIAVLQCGAGSTGTMQTVKEANKLKRPIGCYDCNDPEKGDFSGNRQLIDQGMASALKDTESLRELLQRHCWRKS